MGASRRRFMKYRRRWNMAYHRARKKIRAGLDTSVIPLGIYCYTYIKDEYQCCPFWSTRPEYGEQHSGYCSLLEIGDWQVPMGLLWDQVKECGINNDYESEM